MKKLFYILICFALSISCTNKTKTLSISSKKQQDDNQWRQYFKDKVLCNCILKGVGDQSVTDRFHKVDKSFYNEVAFILNDDIEEILNPIIKKMKKDSIESLTTVSEAGAGKNVFDDCLKFYRSKQLDSITKLKLEKWASLNKDSLMSIKAPAY